MGMSQQIINVGSSPNDGAGDPIRTAFIKTNTNFTQLFALPNPTPPATLVGKAGDVPGMYAYNSNYFYYCFGTYDGSTVIWAQVSQINSISVSNIVNGTSNVRIASANSNVTISVNGTSNVAVFSNTGITTANLSVTGISNFSGNLLANYISAVGNVRGINIKTSGEVTAVGNVYGNAVVGTYLYGDGSNISNISGNYGDANVSAFMPTYGGNILANFMSVTGNIQAFAYYTNNNLSAGGNVIGANFNTAGIVSATGNIQGNYILGDGSLLSGIPAYYTDANVAAFLPTYTGNLAVASINITGDIIPTASSAYSLGNATNQWADLYVSNSSIHIGNQVLTTYTGNLFFNDNLVFTGNGTSSNVTANVTGITTGLHNGLVNSFDIKALSWDFGYIAANTYTNPIQYLFRVTSAGNIDMGTCTVPSDLYIDIGTINASTVN
jgi:hypothetical protein